MKKLILLICMLAGMSSCYHEDALIVPEQPDKYNILTDDPSDPTQHFIYQFYQKYQTAILMMRGICGTVVCLYSAQAI